MDRVGFAHGFISEHLHILVNRGEMVDNELLKHGMRFYVEEGQEEAKSDEEVQALRIEKLMKKLELA